MEKIPHRATWNRRLIWTKKGKISCLVEGKHFCYGLLRRNSLQSRLNECQSQIELLLRDRASLLEQISQLVQQSASHPIEDQTNPYVSFSWSHSAKSSPSLFFSAMKNRSTAPDQRIPRRVFEQEILAWSKESEQLKQFVKQIQIENKKLKDIILKLERMIQDYMHENERLKQENQHLSFLSYPVMETLDEIGTPLTSDTDICYLTLKCLTYEVAQRVSSNNEPTIAMADSNDPYLKQRLSETERQVGADGLSPYDCSHLHSFHQLKIVRIQNQRLKKQLENYTFQLKHYQHETNGKNQELAALKIETDK